MTHAQYCLRCDELYEAIVTFSEENRYPPSIRELADLTGIASTQTVVHHLDWLEKRERINRHPGISRGITIRTGEARA